jgi:bifunctional non-homologous end joining protein LigD
MLEFVVPATPDLRSAPPRGPGWLHEVKFDGWRVQLHKYGKFVQLYSRGGHKAARRFSDLVAALARIPARSCVIDGEVVACDTRGLPDFHALHFLRDDCDVCVCAFDLLYLGAKDVRGLPLVERKALLTRLVLKTADSRLRLSETFDDGAKLLAAAEKTGLEGVVSKRRDAPYRSGTRSGWIKVKTLDWLMRNRERWRWHRSAER